MIIGRTLISSRSSPVELSNKLSTVHQTSELITTWHQSKTKRPVFPQPAFARRCHRLTSNPVCATCFKHASEAQLQKCGGCKAVFYCDKDCQKADWNNHKKTCKSSTSDAGPSFSNGLPSINDFPGGTRAIPINAVSHHPHQLRRCSSSF